MQLVDFYCLSFKHVRPSVITAFHRRFAAAGRKISWRYAHCQHASDVQQPNSYNSDYEWWTQVSVSCRDPIRILHLFFFLLVMILASVQDGVSSTLPWQSQMINWQIYITIGKNVFQIHILKFKLYLELELEWLTLGIIFASSFLSPPVSCHLSTVIYQ